MALKSYGTATRILRELYANTPHSDVLPKADMFAAMGRDSRDRKAVVLLWSRLSILRQHDLISTEHAKTDGKREIESITLTEAGRRALDRNEDSQVSHTPSKQPVKKNTLPIVEPSRVVTPESVLADVRILQKQNPSFDVRLVFAPKEEPIEQR